MKTMSIKDLGRLIDAKVVKDTVVNGVSVDSRKVSANDLFVCLRGQRVDGHDYAHSAIEKGATALMVDHPLKIDIPQIIVSDTLKGLIELAEKYRSLLDMSVIAITGSNGKTSTKDILNTILQNCGPTVATYENQNTEIGTALTIFRCDEKTEYGVFEMGLDLPGEIAAMTKIAKPDAAILTSIDQAHMTSFEDMKHLAREKFSIFDTIHDKKMCFYQGDDYLLKSLAQGEISFGFNQDNDYVISNVSVDNEGVSFSLSETMYRCNLLGKHQASNATGAVLLLRALGISPQKIQTYLSQVQLTSMRMEVLNIHNATILFDAYKASPQGMLYAIDFLDRYAILGPRYLVLGGMYLLGDGGDKHHETVLKKALETSAKRIFLYGPEWDGLDDVNNPRVCYFTDKKLLREALTQLYAEKCLLLFKGSRTYKLESLLER